LHLIEKIGMQDEISVLIIEDDEFWSKSLSANLNDFGFSIAGVANNFETAITALNQKDYDIVLLDIHLDGKESGIEIGKMISTLYHKPFIFITASLDAQVAHSAFGAKPSSYLIKPVNPTSLFATIHTAIHNYTDHLPASIKNDVLPNDSFFVKQGDKYKKVFWKDVVCLRSDKNYTGVLNATDNSVCYIRSTLPKTLRYLVPAALQSQFVQVNRSEAIQLSFITELTKDEVKTAYKSFAVTEGYLKELKEKLHILS
jgi:DNA-binding LytR/AlgR family response regulator